MSLPMSAYNQLLTRLVAAPHTWLITGVAGFIGSNLAARLGALGADGVSHLEWVCLLRGFPASKTMRWWICFGHDL